MCTGIEGVGSVDIAEGDPLTGVVDIHTSRPLTIAGEDSKAGLRDRGTPCHTEGLYAPATCCRAGGVGEVGLIDRGEGCHIEGDTPIDTKGNVLGLTEAKTYSRLGGDFWGREEATP